MRLSRTVAYRALPAIMVPLLVFLTIAGFAVAQDDEADSIADSSATDQIQPDRDDWSDLSPLFAAIQLTAEGVIGVDTTGQQWRYDFTEAVFVPIDFRQEESGAIREYAGESRDASLPVEQRATEPRTVRPFERWVVVGYDEYVDGDIIAYGRVTVKGWVKGNVQSLTSRVLVTETGQVDGNVQAPRILVKEGGVVLGKIKEGAQIDVRDLTAGFSADGVIVAISLTAGFLFVVFLIASLTPGPMSRVEECMRRYPGRSFIVGFGFHLFIPLVLAVVAITIVGLLVLPLVPLAYLLGELMGLAVVGNRLGGRLCRRFCGGEKGPVIQSLIGTLMYMLPWIVTALFLGSSSDAWQIPGVILLVLNILLAVYVGSSGLGATVLTRFGYRPYVSFHDRQAGEDDHGRTPTPAPPPIPESPPVTPPPKPPGPPPPRPNNL